MMIKDYSDLMGHAEVAEALGVTRQCLMNWRTRRSDFPAPVLTLAMGPVWRAADIAAWSPAKGR